MQANSTLDMWVAQLQDNDPICRVLAVNALSQMGDNRAIGALVWLMADPSLWVQCSAAEALGEFRSEAVVGPLVAFLRLGAQVEQENVGPPLEVPIRFHAFIRHDDPVYQGWLADQNVRMESTGLNLAVSARLALQKVGILSTRALVQLLTDENPYVVYVAVHLLNSMCMQPEPHKALVAALESDQPEMRQGVARAMGRLGNLQAVEPLVKHLNDPHLAVQRTVIESLGIIQDRRATEPLLETLRITRDDLQAETWAALMNLGVRPGDFGY
jgi:HEAT repeat protein